jgi:hypothetical protein
MARACAHNWGRTRRRGGMARACAHNRGCGAIVVRVGVKNDDLLAITIGSSDGLNVGKLSNQLCEQRVKDSQPCDG